VISEEIARGAAENGWVDEVVYLNDYVITPCQSCGPREDDDVCIYHDDIYPVYDRFQRCDAVVAASPMYFDTVSAQMKLFIDRCNCFRIPREAPDGRFFLEKKRWKRRNGIVVLVGGERQKYESALRVLKGFFIWTGVEFLEAIRYSHSDWRVGGVKEDENILKHAYSLGRSL
jgi:multimeric flavodoxin WrbA